MVGFWVCWLICLLCNLFVCHSLLVLSILVSVVFASFRCVSCLYGLLLRLVVLLFLWGWCVCGLLCRWYIVVWFDELSWWVGRGLPFWCRVLLVF